LDAEIDAWRGGALFCTNEIVKQGNLQEFSINKAQYEECGHHYLKEHACSNFLYGQKPIRGSSTAQLATEFQCQQNKRLKT
jgi:hypothetical protein